MASTEDITHQAISSYFIGPRAENLDEIQRARERYFKEDVVRSEIRPLTMRHELISAGKWLHIHPALGPAIG